MNIISKLQNSTDNPNVNLVKNPVKTPAPAPQDINTELSDNQVLIDDKKKKKIIINKIKLINNKCYLNNIFIFIKSHNIKYTLNNNGVFFNLNSLPSKILDLFYNHINSIISNIDIFDNDDNHLQNIKDTINVKYSQKLPKYDTTAPLSISLSDFTTFEKDVIKFATTNTNTNT